MGCEEGLIALFVYFYSFINGSLMENILIWDVFDFYAICNLQFRYAKFDEKCDERRDGVVVVIYCLNHVFVKMFF